MSEYDEIIVGGGSAGIALATRLTEDAARRVLLIEAGPDQRGVVEGDRLGDTMKFSTTLTEWAIDATFLPGRSSITHRAGSSVAGPRSMGGLPSGACATTTNAGLRSLARNGRGLTCCRALCRLEADQDFTGESHGTNGPVPVVRWREDELLPVQQAFRDAVMGHGVPWVKDFNAPDTSGIGAIPMNRQDGVRMSTALTYLPLCRARDNLTIQAGTQVVRVVIEHGRATGVEVLRNGQLEQVSAERVLLCAGALQSPTLLLRSGIGPAGPLADMGIDCVVELTGVGENLMEHQGTVVFLIPRDELGPPDIRGCQLGARYSSSAGPAADDMWLAMWSTWELATFPDLKAALGVPSVSAVIVGVHDPASRGTVRLRSRDPHIAPAVDFRMLSEPADMLRLVEGLELAIDLASSPSFAESYSRIGLLDTSTAKDRAALEAYIKSTVAGWFHAAGTCRMGTDPDSGAVVDAHLRVHGVEGLHVVDASVMPTVPRAPTNLSSIAIGERAAELPR